MNFKLKTTQLETVFNSCSEGVTQGQLSWGEGGAISWEAIVRGVVVQGGIIQGLLSGGQKPGGNCPRGNLMGSNCPRGSCQGQNYSGAIVWEIKFPGVIVQGRFHGKNYPGGSYPGENCHWTDFNISTKNIKDVFRTLSNM